MDKQKSFNSFTQYAMPSLTIGSQVAIAFKYPEWGLIINLMAQPFWFYSSWKAYKQAGQSGILITTIIITIVLIGGIINYWFL